MSQPLVSVLTPSFNQARWLGDNLRSVAMQTYSNIEHVVMDGNSTDGSVELLAKTKHYIRWDSGADRGQSHALNKAFSLSRGDIIGWLNSDDAYFDQRAVEIAVRTFERHPEVDVVYGHAVLVNPEGLIIQMMWVPPFNYGILRNHNFIIQPSSFIRRSALGSTVVREAYDYCMDRELWLRLGKDRWFHRVNAILAIDRHHLTRKSLTRIDLKVIDTKRLVAEYGVPQGHIARARLKVLKVMFRMIGVSLLPSLNKTNSCGTYQDSLWHLGVRQLAATRARMPMGRRPAVPSVEAAE